MTYANGEEGDRLVDAPEGGNIDGLATDGTLGANASRVFAGTGVDDGVNEDLRSGYYDVSIGGNLTNLNGVLVGEEMDDFESVLDDADGKELLAVVATLHHQAKCK